MTIRKPDGAGTGDSGTDVTLARGMHDHAEFRINMSWCLLRRQLVPAQEMLNERMENDPRSMPDTISCADSPGRARAAT